jgi:hypothetical protein
LVQDNLNIHRNASLYEAFPTANRQRTHQTQPPVPRLVYPTVGCEWLSPELTTDRRCTSPIPLARRCGGYRTGTCGA